jgi:hypothetical protein
MESVVELTRQGMRAQALAHLSGTGVLQYMEKEGSPVLPSAAAAALGLNADAVARTMRMLGTADVLVASPSADGVRYALGEAARAAATNEGARLMLETSCTTDERFRGPLHRQG